MMVSRDGLGQFHEAKTRMRCDPYATGNPRQEPGLCAMRVDGRVAKTQDSSFNDFHDCDEVPCCESSASSNLARLSFCHSRARAEWSKALDSSVKASCTSYECSLLPRVGGHPSRATCASSNLARLNFSLLPPAQAKGGRRSNSHTLSFYTA